MPKTKPARIPRLIVVVEPDGVQSVHFTNTTWEQERAALGLYDRLRAGIDALDALARY